MQPFQVPKGTQLSSEETDESFWDEFLDDEEREWQESHPPASPAATVQLQKAGKRYVADQPPPPGYALHIGPRGGRYYYEVSPHAGVGTGGEAVAAHNVKPETPIASRPQDAHQSHRGSALDVQLPHASQHAQNLFQGWLRQIGVAGRSGVSARGQGSGRLGLRVETASHYFSEISELLQRVQALGREIDALLRKKREQMARHASFRGSDATVRELDATIEYRRRRMEQYRHLLHDRYSAWEREDQKQQGGSFAGGRL